MATFKDRIGAKLVHYMPTSDARYMAEVIAEMHDAQLAALRKAGNALAKAYGDADLGIPGCIIGDALSAWHDAAGKEQP